MAPVAPFIVVVLGSPTQRYPFCAFPPCSLLCQSNVYRATAYFVTLFSMHLKGILQGDSLFAIKILVKKRSDKSLLTYFRLLLPACLQWIGRKKSCINLIFKRTNQGRKSGVRILLACYTGNWTAFRTRMC